MVSLAYTFYLRFILF